RTEQPLVPIGGEEVDRRPADVEGQDTEPLDGVDEEQDAALAAQVTESIEVVAEPAGELDEAEAEDARACVHRRANVVDIEPAVAAADAPGLDAAAGQVQPGIDVGGVFLFRDDDVIAGLPRVALGDDADAFAGVLDEGDVERIGVDEPAE